MILITFRAWNRFADPLLPTDCNHSRRFLKPHSLSVPPLNVIDNLDCCSLLPLSNSQPAVDSRYLPLRLSASQRSAVSPGLPLFHNSLFQSPDSPALVYSEGESFHAFHFSFNGSRPPLA